MKILFSQLIIYFSQAKISFSQVKNKLNNTISFLAPDWLKTKGSGRGKCICFFFFLGSDLLKTKVEGSWV